MMKKTLMCCLALSTVIACTSNKQTNQETEVVNPENQIEATFTDEHNAENSLDYFGIYEGVTPCADCEGIKVRLTLNKDKTFAIKSVYIKNGEEILPSEASGNFAWNDAGNIITLENAIDQPSRFFVGEGSVTIVDENGEKILGELAKHYILTQTETF